MTIRKQWILVLTLTAFLTVAINSLLLFSLINKSFLSYSQDTYDAHLRMVEQLAQEALKDETLTQRQLEVQLTSHLDDPIVSITLYNASGQLVAQVEKEEDGRYASMRGMMGNMMRSRAEETDSIDIKGESGRVGVLLVTRYSALGNSIASTLFKGALLRNSLLSFGVVMAVLIIIGVLISRRLSRDLRKTAELALSIDMEGLTDFVPSKLSEIRTIQASLGDLHRRLKLKQMGRKQLVDEIVHQTRTPLTVLKTHLEGIEDGVLTMTPEEISLWQAQVDGLLSILSNMTMLLDAGRQADAVVSGPVDLPGLLHQIVQGLRVQFEKKTIDLTIEPGPKAMVETDKNKLGQCVYNLLTNAYKFTPPGGQVTLSYGVTADTVSVTVRDTGAGIAKEDLPNIFTAYYRGQHSADTPGEGLGLYIVRELITQLGGTVTVASTPVQGSTFTLTLPMTTVKELKIT